MKQVDDTSTGLTRREALGALPALALAPRAPARSKMGIADFSYAARRRLDRARGRDAGLNDPLNFLEHAHRVGSGGIQTGLGVRDKAAISKLRARAEEYGMTVQGSIRVPRKKADVERFEAQVKTAKAAGSEVIRSIHLLGRRYETFASLEQWEAFMKESWTSLTLAEPVLARHRARLAFENHKDFRIPEMIGLLKRISSEWIGAWVDFSNSFSLLEDNMDVVKALAPYAFAAHVKDMAVAETEDGMLNADVVFGKGIHDLSGMIGALRKANPSVLLVLEMSTRDPLRVACLKEKYWITMKGVPARDLAKILKVVRDHASPLEKLPKVNHLPLEERVRIEDENIRACLAYSREKLGV